MTTSSLTGPDFSKNDGLLPAIAQDAQTGEVLMLAWMNADSFAETVRTGHAVYYSRSRGKLWRKGEESGHVQAVRGIYIDCDADTILLKVDQFGAACHEGYRSCFFRMVTKEGVQVVSERLVEPEQVYGTSRATNLPKRPSGGSMFNRTCVALAYFSFMSLLFYRGIPHYSTVPLILLGVSGLMILALMMGVYWSVPDARERKKVNLLTIFVFIAVCAMLLGTITGLIRGIGGITPGTDLTELIWSFLVAAALLFISFPFAVYLAEALIWNAAAIVRMPKVRAVVRRLIP